MRTGRVDHQPGFVLALDAVDTAFCTSGLKSWMPTLMRLKPSSASSATVASVDLARIDLDGILAVRHQREVLADDDGHQPRSLVVRQEGRRAAAEVKLQLARPSPGGDLQIEFLSR